MKKIVRIVTDNHHYNQLYRQWDANADYAACFDVRFDDVQECDVLIVLEYPKTTISCKVAKENTWVWSMEPPDEEWEWLRKCYKYFSKVVTVDAALTGEKFIQQQLAIPWQVEFDYATLAGMDVFEKKNKGLSFITSSYAARKGHRKRLWFLQQIQPSLQFDLFGRGFTELQYKSQALLPYKYTIVAENSSYRNYWSEKIADAFLCGCLPFYYGCKNLEDYFDKDAFIRIDINKPEQAIKIINRAMKNNEWEKRKDAIIKARQKILQQYQFFPVMAKMLHAYNATIPISKADTIIPVLEHHPSQINPFSIHRIYYRLKKFFFKKRYNDPGSNLFGFVTYK